MLVTISSFVYNFSGAGLVHTVAIMLVAFGRVQSKTVVFVTLGHVVLTIKLGALCVIRMSNFGFTAIP